jgi:hypothetical protein
MRRTVRAIENNIDDVFDHQRASYASLALARTYEVRPRVIDRLIWLREVLENWYGGVTDIFHDELMDLFSRILCTHVYQALKESQRGQAKVQSYHSDTCL